MKALKIHIKGRVQGVGMRPFIYRLAKSIGISGNVYNHSDGVWIHAEATDEKINFFIERIKKEAPPASTIKEIHCYTEKANGFSYFTISKSEEKDNLITEICPDIAVCIDCIYELKTSERRNSYPFINCTHCGPRFTIINDFPYDRALTSMHSFEMCPDCKEEYHNPSNRRFHAQPTSCKYCGPVYIYNKDNICHTQFNKILRVTSDVINNGKVIALKGLGGYNLVCSAEHESAIREIRNYKQREKKPMAVMFRSIEAIQEIAFVNEFEKNALLSWQRPIVILKLKPGAQPTIGITSGLNTIGVLLPYLPIHYLLFDEIETSSIVLTSGNESDSPILISDSAALNAFSALSGGIISHNREISHRIDDSVVQIICNTPRLIRRARGYVPSPIDTRLQLDGILATGAELSNCFCLGKSNQAIMSQHIGDLKNAETYQFFTQNIEELSRLYRFEPRYIACDLHPDYLSTQYALKSALPVIQVQHHHAHIAACMAEHHLAGPVIGISYDGTGLGTDGTIWGSEALIADFNGFERVSHFEYIPLPGGDRANKEPWRSALSYLYNTYGSAWNKTGIPFSDQLDRVKSGLLIEAIEKSINSPLCCSAGRLFDAVAALTGICMECNYHAQAPQLLENYIINTETGNYTIEGDAIISFRPMFREMVDELIAAQPLEQIITKFHNTVALVALIQVKHAASQTRVREVCLSGGTFQNKYLCEKIVHLLEVENFKVFLPLEVPCNDAGIALGQIAVASHKINQSCV